MAAQQPDVTPLVAAQGLAQARLTDVLVTQVRAQVGGFQGWYDGVAVAAMSDEVANTVQTAQKVLASITDAYVTRSAGMVTGKAIRAGGAVDVTGLRRNAPLPDVYNRLARNYRYLVAEGKTLQQARRVVVARAAAMSATDMQLAARAQAQASLQQQRVTGYRRVIHPEASRSGVCGLCVAASDRIYHVADLLPIHDDCRCTVLPVTAQHDPGLALNKADLAQIYAEAGGTGADKLKRVQYKVRRHGELGPLLVNSKYAFRDAKDVAA